MANNNCYESDFYKKIKENKRKLQEKEKREEENKREEEKHYKKLIKCAEHEKLKKKWKKYKKEFPLHYAASQGNLKDAKNLINDHNLFDENGHTPLMLSSYKGHIEIIKFLLENGADIDQRTENCSSQRDWSALVCAASRKESTDDWSEEKQNFMVEWNFGISDMPFDGYPKTVQLLLRLGAGKNSFNLKKAIEVAKEQNLEKIVKILEYYFQFHLII